MHVSESAAAKLIEARDAATLGRLLAAHPALAAKPRLIVAAGGAGDAAIVRLLLSHGADPNGTWRKYRALHALVQTKPHGDTPAAGAAQLECLDALLEGGADPELPGSWYGMRVVPLAALSGADELLDRLLARGFGQELASAAVLGQRAKLARALEREPELARRTLDAPFTLLHLAAGSRRGRGAAKESKAQRAIVELLLERGADPNAVAKTGHGALDPAYFAVASQDLERLRLLLAAGASATAALVSALWNGTLETAELVLQHGANPDEARHEGKPLLNQLVRWGQLKQVLWLASRGASANLPDERGWTSMHQAASRGNLQMLEALLATGGDAQRADKQGLTPLAIAALCRRPKLVERMRAGAAGAARAVGAVGAMDAAGAAGAAGANSSAAREPAAKPKRARGPKARKRGVA